MRTAVFIGAIVIMLLGFGIFSGTIGTLEGRHKGFSGEYETYNICVHFGTSIQCLPISESVMHFFNTTLMVPPIQSQATLVPQGGNYYY